MLPVESASIVVRKVPLSVTKEQMEQIFLKAGAIKYVYFPKVPRHFTTKYCFIKFYDIRRAREAQQLFDGYRLGDQWLQVVAYDPTYKFRHSCSTQSLNTPFESRPNLSSGSGQQSPRANVRHESTPVSRASSPVFLTQYPTAQRTLPNSTPSFLAYPPCLADVTFGACWTADNEASLDDQHSDSEYGDYLECPVVDNILLDSEVGFWSWLEQRIHAFGPLHYKTSEIDRVLLKLPIAARKQFAWPLGAFRLCDKDRFQLIGPFICLSDQTMDARAKCLALCCNWRAPFREFWEPMAPSEIHTAGQLIQYLRKHLTQFGPQSMDDMKIRQVFQCLLPEVRNSHELKLSTPGGFAEFLDSPNATKIFGVVGSIVYLIDKHTHILRLSNEGSGNDSAGKNIGEMGM